MATDATKKLQPWLAPLTVTPAMRRRLDRAHTAMSKTLGAEISRATFVRILLERGMEAVEKNGVAPSSRSSRKNG